MVRWLTLFSLAVLIVLSWMIFELQNGWAFNQTRLTELRLTFLSLAIASALPVMIARLWWAAPTLLATAFVTTSILSNARIHPTYLIMAAFLVLLMGIVSRATWQHAKVP